MSIRMKWLIGAGIVGVVALMLVAGGVVEFWFATSPVAQASTLPPGAAQGSCHDNQSVFQLLGTSREELLAQRKAGKSLLGIAQAKGVIEDKLTNALLQPMKGMHGDSQSNLEQMTQGMRDQFAEDIRETNFGTMTDFHLGLSDNGNSGMTPALHQTQCGAIMGGAYGRDMMDGVNSSGMMGGSNGMMRNWKP